ncbi:MAG: ThuA domain-containing protein [Bacteroidales bacterium]
MKTKTLVHILCLIIFMVLNIGATASEIPSTTDSSQKLPKVLLFTGGHGFDKASFYGMIFSLQEMEIDTISQPLANQSLLSDTIDRYDVIVFYDMWQDISFDEKEAFLELTKKGTGLVFLHHSLVSYQTWPVFTQIRGGKYYERGYNYVPERFSGYKHDIVLEVKIADTAHPVTRGLTDFSIHDEGYFNVGINEDVTPLLSTSHPECSPIVAWANEYSNSKIVYILLGHDNNSWSNDNFQKLLRNAISWTGN